LQRALTLAEAGPETDPLPGLKKAIRLALRQTVNDPQTRRVFEVATHKVEYVDSLCAVRERHLRMRALWIDRFRDGLRRSAEVRGVRLGAPAAAAAHGLHALLDGVVQNWLLDPSEFDLEAVGTKALETYLRGLGLE
jgi:TetR/AcrR family acrAB operon transcriptional repressor